MRKLLIAASTIIGCVLVFAGSMDANKVSGRSEPTVSVEVTFSKAYGASRGQVRRTSRRTARRTSRRVSRRHSLVVMELRQPASSSPPCGPGSASCR